MTALGFLADHNRMALGKRTALNVLAGQSHRHAFNQQGAEGKAFCRRPIDALALLDRSPAAVEDPAQGAVQMETLSHYGQLEADLF